MNKKNNAAKIRDTALALLGVHDGETAYTGPLCVQIDLTNKCNNNCIGCWCNSPLLAEQLLPPAITNATLPTPLVIRLLDELRRMGTAELYFAGGGEPFMHPDAAEIFTYAKKLGFVVSVNTNCTLLDAAGARRLVDAGVDHLIVSVWAGTPEIYVATHPNKTADTFYGLKETLTGLNRYKQKKGHPPVIKIYNVVFNSNVRDFDAMIDFCIATGSESVEFTLIDTIPGKTDSLLLSHDEARSLYETACRVRQRYQHDESPVYLANYETFLRRVSSTFQTKGEYDRDVLSSIPCYAGWAFARIIANGDVNSCLKSHRIPVGNIHRTSFRTLWNNARQRQFRRKTRRIEPHDPYFRFIGNDTQATVGCFRSCDNLGHSLLIHERVQALSPWQRTLMKTAGILMRSTRSLWLRN